MVDIADKDWGEDDLLKRGRGSLDVGDGERGGVVSVVVSEKVNGGSCAYNLFGIFKYFKVSNWPYEYGIKKVYKI